jgi:hypothetical protein
MWIAWVVAAIALAAAVFMFRFLVALVHEVSPSVGVWIVPVPRGPQGRVFDSASANYVEDDRRTPERNRGENFAELLENKSYAKEERSSGLIALDVRPAYGGLGWRSIHARRGPIFPERRL